MVLCGAACTGDPGGEEGSCWMRQSRLLLRAAEEGGEPAAAALSAATAAAVAGDVVNSISNAMVAPGGPAGRG